MATAGTRWHAKQLGEGAQSAFALSARLLFIARLQSQARLWHSQVEEVGVLAQVRIRLAGLLQQCLQLLHLQRAMLRRLCAGVAFLTNTPEIPCKHMCGSRGSLSEGGGMTAVSCNISINVLKTDAPAAGRHHSHRTWKTAHRPCPRT